MSPAPACGTPPIVHRHSRATRMHRLAALLLTLLLTLCASWSMSVRAVADDTDGERPSGGSDGTTTVSLSAESLTSVVSNSSGYHAVIVIANHGDNDAGPGTLSVSTNPLYTFSSQVDMQQWADGTSRIPTPTVLATVKVDGIRAGQRERMTVSVKADNPQLKAISSWGPKPLRFDYRVMPDQGDQAAGGGTQGTAEAGSQPIGASLESFMTRSTAGLRTAGTPALDITVAMPLTARSWTGHAAAIDALVNPSDDADGTASSNESDVVTADRTSSDATQDVRTLLENHPDIQAVADPSYLSAIGSISGIGAVMQPSHVDIAALSGIDAYRIQQAGVTSDLWNGATAVELAREAIGAESANPTPIAWQGSGNWTMTSLAAARSHGYATVIADDGYEPDTPTAAHTGKYQVTTSAGQVTVLTAQRELTRLARGQASSNQASAESTPSGRLARFMALSAFYQMEQPYAERVLLVCLNSSVDPGFADALMRQMEQAPWIDLSSLSTLRKAAPYLSSDAAQQAVAEDSDGSESLDAALDSLTASRDDIIRFGSSILTKQESASPSATGSTSSDTQALARGQASRASRKALAPDAWLTSLLDAQTRLALHALSDATSRTAMVDASRDLSNTLLDGVRIAPSESLSVVGDSASMPVTISNSYPYPVRVQVSSETGSPEIVTSSRTQALIAPRSETQVTFTIRVLTSGQATAHLRLLDREGIPFGTAKRTHITSAFRFNDRAGLSMVGFAGILGVLGLWRQFHRRKDEDE